MRRISTETTIHAGPAQVWEVLIDFASYPEWNPFLRVTGQPRVGSRLTVRLIQPNGREATFRPRVLAVEPGRTLRWKGKLGPGGLFNGEHEFVLHDGAEDGGVPGTTRLVHAETFTGALIPLSGRILAATRDGFAAVNSALRARVQGEQATSEGGV